MLNPIQVSVIGSDHLAYGRPLQDFAKAVSTKDFAICSVADGHGADKHFRSATGSMLASNIAVDELEKFGMEFVKSMRQGKDKLDLPETIENLERRIICRWKESVKNHFHQNPLTEEEKVLYEQRMISSQGEFSLESIYGTTLIAGICIPHQIIIGPQKPFWLVLQIGDGLCFVKEQNKEIYCPIPEEKKESPFLNYTKSISSSNAKQDFKHVYGFSNIEYLCVCTDGLSNSFSTDGLKEFITDINSNVKAFGVQKEQKELEKYFPTITRKGVGDDLSLAGIFR